MICFVRRVLSIKPFLVKYGKLIYLTENDTLESKLLEELKIVPSEVWAQ